MSDLPSLVLKPADLPTDRPTDFDLVPARPEADALARALGIRALKKVRFAGALMPLGRRDWRLTAHLGATAVQDCIVTLDPVTTRIEEDVERMYLAQVPDLPDGGQTEIEMPEDDSVEPLTPEIDLGAVLREALVLALPAYPRTEGATVATAIFTEPGKAAMRDEDARPFAGLSRLRDGLGRKDD